MDFRKFANVKRADLENEDELDKTEDEAEEPAQGFSSMRELYDALDIGDGGPVYLSDGVWLYPTVRSKTEENFGTIRPARFRSKPVRMRTARGNG